VNIDEETGVLIRNGIEKKTNPFDRCAIETAVQLKEAIGCRVTALSMGPPDARTIIQEAFAMGVDDGFLLSDTRFSGSDVLSTAYTLSRAIRKLVSFDLIICGRQTTDGDTAQVGSELAEFLSIPGVSEVREILGIKGKEIRLLCEGDYYESILSMQLPGLICISKDSVQPRLPSYVLKKKCEHNSIPLLSYSDLSNGSDEYFGLDGPPTRVIKIFPPDHSIERNMYRGS